MSVTRSARKNRLSSKSTRHQAIAAISAAASLVAWGAVSKADTYGFNDTSTALNTVSPTPWTDETVPSVGVAAPGSGDTAQFDSLAGLTGPTVLTLGQNTTWGGLTVLNPGAAITIGNVSGDDTNTLTLGSVSLAGGINMSGATQNLTIVDPVSINAISQSFLVNTGQTLTLNAPISLSTATSTATLTFGGGGTQNVNGAVSDTAFTGGAIAETGAGTVVLTNANNYSGNTTLSDGVMELNFNAAGATASNILPMAAQLRLGGGTLLVNGSATSVSSQTFSSAATNGPTFVTSGLSTIQVTDNSGGAHQPTLALGTMSIDNASTNLGGLVEFIGPATSTDGLNATPVPATGTINVGSTLTFPSAGGILVDNGSVVPFAVVGQANGQVTDFAASSGGVVVGGSTIAGFYTPLPSSGGESFPSDGSTVNFDVSNAGEIRISSNTAVASLRFNSPTGGSFAGTGFGGNNMDQIILKSGNVLEPGAILVTPNVGANSILIQDAGGPATAMLGGEGVTVDVTVFQYNTQGALIVDGGIRSATGHSGGYAQAGPGAVQLNGTGATTFNLATNLYGGLTILGNSPTISEGLALGSSTSIFLNGGNIDADYTGTFDDTAVPARPITVGAVGGGVSATAGNTVTVDGVISGGGPLNIGYGAITTNEENATSLALTTTNTTGAGTVILSGNNTFTGGINVNAGTLRIDTAGASAGTGNISVNNGGSLAGNGTLEYSASPALYNNVTVKSGGQFTPGDPIPLGPTVGTMTLGSLNLNSGSITNMAFASVSSFSTVNVNGNLNIANNAIFNFDQSGSTNPFIFSGTYDLFTVTGSVTLGTPVFGSNAAGYSLSTAPDGADTFVVLTLMGVTPETWNTSAGGSWATAGSWYPNPQGVPNSVGATAEFLPDVGNTANIASGGTVTLDGNETVGTLIFQNSNSFTIAAGTTVPTSVLHIQAVGTGSGTITDSAGSHTFTAPVSLDSAVTNVTVSNSGTSLTFGGTVEGVGALTINPTGAGTVILSANNTYGGATTIDGGTLQVGTGTTGSLGRSATPVVNKGALVMDVNTSQTITVGSTPANGTGSITQNGTGLLALAGVNNAGAMAINHSEIQLATGASLTTTGDLTMATSTLLDLNGNSAAIGGLAGAGTIDDVAGTGTTTLSFGSDNNTNTFSGLIQNTSSTSTVAVTKLGTGTETLSAVSTYSGGTTIAGGAILVTTSSGINSGVGSGTITADAANGLQLGNGVTLSNAIADGAGTVEFEDVPSGSATLSGAIAVVGSGQYRVGTISPTATLNLTGASTGGTASLFIITRGNIVVDGSGGSISNGCTSSALLIGRQSGSSTLNMTIENGGQLNSVDGITFGSNNAADDGTTTLTVQSASSVNAGGSLNLNYDQTANCAITINITGGSSLTATEFQNLSLQGGTSFQISGGSSIIASANDTVAGTGASETGTLFLPEFSNGDLSTAPVSMSVGTGGAIINNGGFNITLGQPMNDAGGGTADTVTYTGTGTTVIANSNGYGGNTTISAGTVVIANGGGSATSNGTVNVTGGTLASASASRITLLQGGSVTAVVGSGATATGGVGVGANLDNSGAGVISGPVVVGAAGTIAPGEVGSFGTMSFTGGFTTVAGSTINFDLGTGTSGAPSSATGDLLNLNGAYAIGSGTVLTFGGTPTVGDYYRLIGGSAITSTSVAAAIAANFTGLPAGYSLNTTEDPDFIDLFVSSIGPATLTWNNAGTNTPSDGRTWDIGNNKNWNSGAPGNVAYTEPGGGNNPNVIFNDSNNSGSNANAYNVTLSTVVSPGSVTVSTTGNYSISGTGTIGGTGSFTKSGTGTLTLSTPNAYTGGTIVTAGKLVIGQAGSNATFFGNGTLDTPNTLTALPTAVSTLSSLSITGNGVVQLADGVTNQTFVTPSATSAHPTSNINLTSLSLTGDGTLDIGNNRIIIDYTTGNDPIASIKQWIANGFTDGEAVGAQPAIISSDVGPDDLSSGFSYGIGYADGADGVIAGLPSGEIEIMFTLVGDANLDGTVNTEDFTPFSNNLNDSGRSWDQGDFNYDGTVNTEDFTPFSHDLNQSDTLAASETGVLNSPLAVSNGISLSNVPEPASTGLLTVGLVSVLARRRRKAEA